MKITYGNIGILRYKFAYFIAFYYFCTQIPDIATYKRIKSDSLSIYISTTKLIIITIHFILFNI